MPKKVQKISIRDVDVKKCMTAGAVFSAIIGLVLALLTAIPVILLNVGLAILLIVFYPIGGALFGGIGAGIVALAHNLAVKVSDGIDVDVKF